MKKQREASWSVHHPGVDPKLDKIVARRFGLWHKKPCRRPDMLTCALWECQERNKCAFKSAKDKL
jgi:hypothetical protein